MSPELLAVESRRAEFRLSLGQAETLRSAGRELAASGAWWGDKEAESTKSVVELQQLGGDRYAVTFRNVVGVVRLSNLQIRIQPKISEPHFLHILRKSNVAPRTSSTTTSLESGIDFASLLALWCVSEAEALLRSGLRPDYNETREELEQVRGRLDVVATCLANYGGRVTAICDFEEFNDDSGLNRIVKAACRLVASSPTFDAQLRSRARRIVTRMAAVGHLRHEDRLVAVSRLTRAYGKVIPLARLLLQGSGVTSRIGTLAGKAFLIRTPELIEDGLRNCLVERLSPVDVRKRRLPLGTSGESINPDLVFAGGAAVADVKYRFLQAEWHRPSLYQAVAFAAGFRSSRCAILGFVNEATASVPNEVPVGDIVARAFGWNASAAVDPHSSEIALAEAVSKWLVMPSVVSAVA